jgi:hypothetical protein
MFAIPFLFLLPIVDLDTLTLERARALDGKLVIATFIVDKSGHGMNDTTSAAAAEQPVHRLARLKGQYPDLKKKKRIIVIGELKVKIFRMCGGYRKPSTYSRWIEIWENGVTLQNR